MARIKFAFLNGTLQQLAIVPDDGDRNPKPRASNEFAGSLNRPDSPYRFFFHWYFQALTETYASKVRVRNWDVVDGHRCLVVDGGQWNRFWIDLERGGNVLKAEDYTMNYEHLRSRAHGIKLKKYQSGDKDIWLPIGGTHDSFKWGSAYHAEPIYRETYVVVDGTVVLGAGLGNRHFSMTSNTPNPESLQKLDLSGRYRDAMSKQPSAPMRTDAVGVRERIDAQLAEADRQETMLAASAPSREWWSWAGASQVLLGVAAVGALATAVVMRRRAG